MNYLTFASHSSASNNFTSRPQTMNTDCRYTCVLMTFLWTYFAAHDNQQVNGMIVIKFSKVGLKTTDTFSSAPTSCRMRNTELPQDDEQIEIVPLTIYLRVFGAHMNI